MTTPIQGSNQDQAEYWNSRTGETWAREQARIDRAFAPLTRALLERAAPQEGESCLDLGCGAGDLTLALARAVGPGGRVTGLDLSRPMLEVAGRRDEASRSEIRARIAWHEADAAETAFAPEYDLVASRFGSMFFAEPVSAFANIRKALRPGGRLALLCWRSLAENEWAALPRQAVIELVGPPEPSRADPPGPFAFADAGRVSEILSRAGFQEVAAHPVEATMPIGVGEDALAEAVSYTVQIGPAAALLRGTEPAIKENAREALTALLAPHLRDGAVALGAACWIYEGVNPA